MAFQPVVDAIHTAIIQELDGQAVINNIYFRKIGGGINPTDLDNANSLAAEWLDMVHLYMADELHGERIVSTNVAEEGGGVSELSIVGHNGQETVPALPGNVAICTSLRSGLSGRSYNGRLYLSGIPTNVVDDAIFTEGFRGNVVASFGSLLVAPAGYDLQWVVASRWADHIQRPVGITTPILSVSADRVCDSMRRRLPGRGR